MAALHILRKIYKNVEKITKMHRLFYQYMCSLHIDFYNKKEYNYYTYNNIAIVMSKNR